MSMGCRCGKRYPSLRLHVDLIAGRCAAAAHVGYLRDGKWIAWVAYPEGTPRPIPHSAIWKAGYSAELW